MKQALSRLPAGTPWSHVEGRDAARVVVYEDVARGGRITLRWWDPKRKNWRRKSLKRQLDKDRRGVPLPEIVEWAMREAQRKSVALGDGLLDPVKRAQARPFTIGETEAAITDRESGKYPHKTPMRDELVRALRFAVTVWGGDTMWAEIDDGKWTQLIRRRLDSLVADDKLGVRTTEITVSRITTAVRWLRRAKKIGPDVGFAPEDWKQDILTYWRGITKAARDPVPSRPRHTIEELRKLLDWCGFVDPRLGLMLALGAEYRLGQIVRAMRSDLTIQVVQNGDGSATHKCTLLVHGQGKKGGETIDLTEGQMRSVFTALGGYLDACEERWLAERIDYPLFPSGRLVRREQLPGHRMTRDTQRLGRRRRGRVFLTKTWILRNFHLAELAAGIDKIEGRGAYGLRRVNVDAANLEGISLQGLKATGGWSSTKMPNEIYAEQENKRGREEARTVRAKTRGEQSG